MILSDVSVRRPVFAMVLSLLLTIIGLMAAGRLAVRETPNVQPPIVSIDTVYRGASASVVESKIAQVIENQIAGLEGVDTLRSSSLDERSRITIEFNLERDIESAANDVRDRVSRVLGNLPVEAEPPEVAKVDTTADPIMWLNLTSDRRSQLELTDYAQRYLVDRFSVVKGVAQIRISGERRYAMRIWLDRQALAARKLTVPDIEDALRAENVELPAGRIESSEREFTLHTDTGLYTPSDFRQLVVGRGEGGYLVRLGEVADVELAAEDLRNVARSDGNPSLSLGRVVLSLSDFNERKESAQQIAARIRPMLQNLAGVRATVVTPGGLGIRGGGPPVQVVLGGGDYEELARWRDLILAKASENPGLTNLDSDFYARKPQLRVSVDRNRAADLGVSLTTVGRTLETMMGSRIVTTFLDRGEEYNVMLQAREDDRATPSDLANIYVRSSSSNSLVPLSNLVRVEETAGPTELKRFDRLRSITISAGLVPGYSLGEALNYMEKLIRTELPAHAQVNFDGESREFKRSGSAIGAVVVYGVMFSLLLTLYVVPVMYGYIARNTRSPEYIAHLIDRLRSPASGTPASSPENPPPDGSGSPLAGVPKKSLPLTFQSPPVTRAISWGGRS